MTKGMAARAGFFSEFLGSNHKENGGIRRRRAPVAPSTDDRPLSPVGGATGPFFFSRDFVANLKKKLHIGPVALWEGDRGIFLKYFKTDIYF